MLRDIACVAAMDASEMSTKTILVADDDRLVRGTVANGLRQAGYEVIDSGDHKPQIEIQRLGADEIVRYQEEMRRRRAAEAEEEEAQDGGEENVESEEENVADGGDDDIEVVEGETTEEDEPLQPSDTRVPRSRSAATLQMWQSPPDIGHQGQSGQCRRQEAPPTPAPPTGG